MNVLVAIIVSIIAIWAFLVMVTVIVEIFNCPFKDKKELYAKLPPSIIVFVIALSIFLWAIN